MDSNSNSSRKSIKTKKKLFFLNSNRKRFRIDIFLKIRIEKNSNKYFLKQFEFESKFYFDLQNRIQLFTEC